MINPKLRVLCAHFMDFPCQKLLAALSGGDFLFQSCIVSPVSPVFVKNTIKKHYIITNAHMGFIFVHGVCMDHVLDK